jgi:hypothetical protein
MMEASKLRLSEKQRLASERIVTCAFICQDVRRPSKYQCPPKFAPTAAEWRLTAAAIQ